MTSKDRLVDPSLIALRRNTVRETSQGGRRVQDLWKRGVESAGPSPCGQRTRRPLPREAKSGRSEGRKGGPREISRENSSQEGSWGPFWTNPVQGVDEKWVLGSIGRPGEVRKSVFSRGSGPEKGKKVQNHGGEGPE